MDNGKSWVRCGEFFKNLRSAVCRTVVHADDFPFSGIILRIQGFKGTLCMLLFIPQRNDHRNSPQLFGLFFIFLGAQKANRKIQEKGRIKRRKDSENAKT